MKMASKHMSRRRICRLTRALSETLLFFEGNRTESHEDQKTCRMRAVSCIQERRLTVQSHLPAQRAGNVRNEIPFVIIAQRVGLHAREKMLLESRRQRIFSEQQQIRAVHILDSRPRVIA